MIKKAKELSGNREESLRILKTELNYIEGLESEEEVKK